MRRTVGFTLAVFVTVLLLAVLYSGPAAGAAAAAAPADKPDGKAIFLAQKCNLCHGVSSAGIEHTTKSEKLAGPDLTGLAAKQDAAFLARYLRKEVDLNGKKHGKELKATDAEVQAVIAWLQQQKAK
jgi:mono/diheme cytochrome c family protein